MLLYRSAVLGLLCAVLLLVAEHREPRPIPRSAIAAPVVVDVSRRALASAQLAPDAVIGARPGERILAVDGARGGAEALRQAWARTSDGGYVDVELAGRGVRRRVLVLAHP